MSKKLSKKEILRYEYNLRLYYDNARKDFDTTINIMLPNQKSLMKTIMWLNYIILSSLVFFFLKGNYYWSYLICLVPTTAIVIILLSLTSHRKEALGYFDIEYIEKIKLNKWAKINGLQKVTATMQQSLNANIDLIEKRSFKIQIATYLTMLTILLSTFIFGYQIYKKGGDNMAKENKPIRSKIEIPPSKHVKNSVDKPSKPKRDK